jgi:4-hydroxy-3-methylbut-2-enyl diphosphate reductase
LREVCAKEGAEAYLVNSADEIPGRVFAWEGRIGVTAGASVPEELVEEVVAALRGGGKRI